jgi:ethanolamine utilization microcompartment shell protein EutS
VLGTETNDETATYVTADDGNETITEFGTDDGTAEISIITILGDEATVTNWDAGNELTTLNGTTTTLDHDDGKTTLTGTETQTVETATKL